jgi:hypothetical protein
MLIKIKARELESKKAKVQAQEGSEQSVKAQAQRHKKLVATSDPGSPLLARLKNTALL